MTIEIMPASGVAAEQATPEETANQNPEVAAPENNEDEQQPQEKSQVDDSDKSLKRLQRRVDRVTAARYQAEARAQQLEAELTQYRQQTRPQEGDQPQINPEDIERIANQRAEQIASQKALQTRVDSVIQAGRKASAEFDALTNTVAEEVPFFDRSGKPTAFLEAILDSDAPAALITYLGKNPDEAADFAGLSAAQIGRRIARMELEINSKPAEPKASKAPKPLEPVKASSAPGEPDMKDTAAWIAWRNKQDKRR